MDHGHGAMEHAAWMEHGVHMEAAGAARCTARGFCVFYFFASRFLYFNNLYSSSFTFTLTSRQSGSGPPTRNDATRNPPAAVQNAKRAPI